MVFRLASPPRYQVYLLRCLEDRSQDVQIASTWRFSLEDPHTGQRHNFAGLEELIDFLRTELTCEGPQTGTQEE